MILGSKSIENKSKWIVSIHFSCDATECKNEWYSISQLSRYKNSVHNCRTCALAIGAKKRIKAKSNEFENKANIIHSCQYIYTSVAYKKAKEKVEIICEKHGSFFQTPNSHLNGRGCPSCKRERYAIGIDKFIEESISVWGKGKFDYSYVNYVNRETKIDIICVEHNIKFSQIPSGHLMKKNCCSKCALGVRGTDNNCIYMWRIKDTRICKIGVTSSRLNRKRIDIVSKKLNDIVDYEVIPIIEFKISVDNANDIERILHNKFKIPPIDFPNTDGKTEFRIMSEEDVINALSIVIEFKNKSCI